MPSQVIDLNDTTPAAPSGLQNNKWQADAPSLDPTVVRNVSTYTPLATTSLPGSVKPDGDTLAVDGTGKISLATGVSSKSASYTAVAADDGQLLVFNSGSAVTLTLPATAPGVKWRIHVQNIGAGALTISPNGRQLDGASGSLSVAQNQGTMIATDGTNYFTERGMGSSSSGLSDPTTTKGDLIVRSASAPTRLGVGTDGYVLTARSSAANGVDWEASSGSGGGVGGNGVFSYMAPVLSNFSWVNQGSASAVQNGNTIFLQTPNATGDQIRALVKAIPAAPKTISIWFSFPFWFSDYYQMGMVLYESSSGKLITFPVCSSGGVCVLQTNNFNSASSFNANNVQTTNNMAVICHGFGMRIRLDGSGNRYFDYSTEGLNWNNLSSSSNTSWITPDKIGFYVNAGGSGHTASMSLLSYLEA